MSLVNDMLRDLEAQGAGARSGDGNEQLLAESSFSKRRGRGVLVPSLLTFVVVGAAVLWLQQSFWQQPSSPVNDESGLQNAVAATSAVEKPAPVESLVETQVLETQVLETQVLETQAGVDTLAATGVDKSAVLSGDAQGPVVAADAYAPLASRQPQIASPKADGADKEATSGSDIAASTVVSEAAPDLPSDPAPLIASPAKSLEATAAVASRANNKQIASLLDAASRALLRDRLTSPKSDNAYDRYQQVLALSPGNAAALAGLETITQRYLSLARDYAEEGNLARARVLLHRADAISPGHREIVHFTQQLSPAVVSESTAATGTASSATSGLVEPTHLAEPTRLVEQAKLVAEPAAASQATAKLQVVRSEQWRDEQMAVEANTLMAKGQWEAARLQLQAFLAAYPQAPKSTQALFHLLLQQGDLVAAQALVQSAGFLPGPQLSQLTARLFLAKNDAGAALQVLEKQPPVYRQQVDFMALLAGAYQKAGRYRDAAGAYQQLLQRQGDNSGYWLGLAVALDALNESGSALVAFQRASQGKQSAEVARYIAARINALSQ